MDILEIINGLVNSSRQFVDNVVPPKTRQDISIRARTIASERPFLVTFITFQVLFTAFPLFLLLTTFLVSLAVFGFAALVALAFTCMMVSVTIFFTTVFFIFPAFIMSSITAAFTWAAGAVSYFALKWAWEIAISSQSGAHGGENWAKEEAAWYQALNGGAIQLQGPEEIGEALTRDVDEIPLFSGAPQEGYQGYQEAIGDSTIKG